MEYDTKNGDKKINDFEKDIVASIYDNDENFYLIDKNRKVFLKKDDGTIIEITDNNRILQVLHLFKPGKTDIIR